MGHVRTAPAWHESSWDPLGDMGGRVGPGRERWWHQRSPQGLWGAQLRQGDGAEGRGCSVGMGEVAAPDLAWGPQNMPQGWRSSRSFPPPHSTPPPHGGGSPPGWRGSIHNCQALEKTEQGVWGGGLTPSCPSCPTATWHTGPARGCGGGCPLQDHLAGQAWVPKPRWQRDQRVGRRRT